MAENVNIDEAAALSEAAGGDPSAGRVSFVAPRDFSVPRTLSADRIDRIRKTLSARLQTIANALAGPLRGHPTMTLGEVAEMSAHGLFDGFVRPFLVHGFICNGQQGWLIWEAAAARIASDMILSGPEPDLENGAEHINEAGELMLTRTERRVVASLLDSMIRTVADEFSLTIESGEIWQEPEEMTTLEDLGPDADSRRMLVHLGIELNAEGPSDLRIYLPGIVDPEEEPLDHDTDNPPPHLSSVDLELSAHLGGIDVPLSELLAIEVGDVIPLDSRIGDLVEIEIEENVCAKARFGAQDGRLVVVIEEVGLASPPAEPNE